MIGEAAQVPGGSTIRADLCIIGGGPAGIVLALELERRGQSVCLLESGGLEPDPEVQALYSGPPPAGQLASRSDYLLASRLRFMGGSSNHWGGYCAPFDAIDFREREWIPDSGWPFDRSHLEPFYRRAARWLEIQHPEGARQLPHRRPLPLEHDSGIETRVYRMSPPVRFGRAYRARLAASRRVQVLLHANAVDLETAEAGKRVDSVRVATLSGGRFRVEARAVALAAGAIENARLLLSSNRARTAGIGNAHDLVGRFFMDHLYVTRGVGSVLFLETPRALSLYAAEAADHAGGERYVGVFRLSDRIQREEALPNHQFRVYPSIRPAGLAPEARDLAGAATDLARAAGLAGGLPREPVLAALELGTEPTPDPANRVHLTDEVDALGMRRVALRYDLSPMDEESIERALRVFAQRLGRTLRARMAIDPDPTLRRTSLAPGSHHIGTTRMHSDPRRGVVDADCRVHDVENLWVAGSSVFPTAGRPNPTFTLVALAVRLAEHLAGKLGGSG